MVKKIDTSEKEYRKIRKARVFVKNIPFDVDSDKIEKIFKKIGEVDSVNFPKKKNKSELKGFGFVQYKHKNIALKAIKELNKRLLGGREIEVSLAVPKKLYEQTNKKDKPKVSKESKEEKETKNNQSDEDSLEDKEDKEDIEDEENTQDQQNGDKQRTIKKDNISKHEKKKKKRERYKENLKLRKNNFKEKVQTVQEAREMNEEGKVDPDFSKSTEEESLNNQGNKTVEDLSKTIFVQNINYSTTESGLKDFFSQFGGVVYARICKSNGVSKGTGFVMFKEVETLEKIVSLFEQSDDSLLFPFELDGKKLKIYRAYDRNDSSQIPDKRPDRRNREFLLFGLYNMNEFSTEVTLQDKEKREHLMKEKKESFKNNPNLFTSTTRVCIRNFSKKITEDQLKDIVNSHLDKWVEQQSEEVKNNYQKRIKQFKLLRNNDEEKKSKVIYY